MVYLSHEILVLRKIHQNNLEDNLFKYFLKKHNRLLFFFKKIVFSPHVMMENLRSEEKDKIKDIKIFFRLNKELNYTAIKDIKYFFR